MVPSVSALWVYPVKSCAGIPVDGVEVTATGLAHDRELMVVDADGVFLSQRSEPRLALVRPTIPSAGVLRLDAPGREPLDVDLAAGGDRRDVDVWGDRVEAVSMGAEADGWFSSWLGRPCALVRMPPDTVRPVDVDHAGPGHRVGFADGYPLLLLSEGSLDELNRRLEAPLPMDRFRPNVVVDGCGPHAEDRWRRLRVGDVEMRVVKPCSRCSITTVDQATAARGPEPLATLADYRLAGGKVLFGQNLVHESRGTLRVGDVVEVLESGRPVPDLR